MTEPKKILVPVDLTDKTRSGVAYAGMLARNFGATLLLVTNVNAPELTVVETYAAENDIDADEAGYALLTSLAAELAPGIEAEVGLTFDDFPADGILSTADRNDVDLIVLASQGRRGVSRFFLGSVAEAVARRAVMPVVIVPSDHDERGHR